MATDKRPARKKAGKRRPAARPRRASAILVRPFRRLLVWTLKAAGAAILLAVLWVLAYRWIDPPGGLYMAAESRRLGGIAHDWRDMEQISPRLARSVMAAEDARFCDHWGFDLEAIRAALRAAEEGGRLRGASTISQQVAKNVFLWQDRSWLRKGLEAGFTGLIEALWPKRRILEIYLNTAEFDAGVFGAEAAAERYFGRPAVALTEVQAARLAAILPAPKARSAARPSDFVRRRAGQIVAGAKTLETSGRDACVFE